MSLNQIESLAKKLAETRDELSAIGASLQAKMALLQNDAAPAIKKLVRTAAGHHAAIETAIDANRPLFAKPRTQIFHSIKVGLRKGSGGIDWDDDARVVALIKKQFPKHQAELLIKTTERPIKKAIEDLDVDTVKRIGCRVEDTDDVIVVKPTDDADDKLVKALLTDAIDQTNEKEEAA